MVAKREASTIPRVLKPLVTIAGCRRPGRCARSSRVSERLRHPVAGERAKLVADVEADVIAFGIDDELGRPRRFARQPLQHQPARRILTHDGDEAVAHLGACGVAVELGPVPRTGGQGAGTSLYFRDPDGSLLEFISYLR